MRKMSQLEANEKIYSTSLCYQNSQVGEKKSSFKTPKSGAGMRKLKTPAWEKFL